jgi:hypothetical protein
MRPDILPSLLCFCGQAKAVIKTREEKRREDERREGEEKEKRREEKRGSRGGAHTLKKSTWLHFKAKSRFKFTMSCRPSENVTDL